jgi:fermentation-respiration switch protein FrsA (DUF1100 family)
MLLRVGSLAAITYLVALVMAAAFADRLIFFPPRPSYGTALDGLVRLESARGDTIAARHVETPGAELTVLFAHGNAEDIGHGMFHADRYAELGVSVLAFDYPGYGLSSGRPSEPGSYAAANAAYRYLTDRRGIAPSAIVAHGRSLGGAVAVDLAARQEIGGLVIESSFVSAYRVMTRYPVSPIDQFMSLKKLQEVGSPVLVIHGERDQVIAPWHGRRLFEAVPGERRHSLWVERAGHNDLAAVAGDRYWDALADFVHFVGGAE